jgi:hypothetical protein
VDDLSQLAKCLVEFVNFVDANQAKSDNFNYKRYFTPENVYMDVIKEDGFITVVVVLQKFKIEIAQNKRDNAYLCVQHQEPEEEIVLPRLAVV